MQANNLQNIRVQQVAMHDSAPEDEVDLRDLIGIVLGGWPLLVSVAAFVLALGVLYAWVAPRSYEADALVQVEEEDQSISAALGDVAELFGTEAAVTAEIELLKSRMIVGTVADDLLLEITAQPKYFPIFGRPLARRFEPNGEPVVAEPVLGLRQYAWGGESITVTALDVPRKLVGEVLVLEVLADGYSLSYDDEEILRGTVGERAAGTVFGGAPVAVFVQDLVGEPGTRFEIVRNERIEVIDDLTERLRVVEKGKDSGILSVSIEDHDPVLARDIVNHLVTAYQRQNVERRSAEAEQTLQFLSKQLPALRKDLESAEVALNNYRLSQGSADLSKETELVLQQSVELETTRMALEQKRQEALQRFTASHPVVQAIDRQLDQVRTEQKSIVDRVKDLPETQQELLRLSRDVEVNTALYTTLLNSAQELQVLKAGTVGNVRVVDYALEAIKPAKPKVALVLALSLVLGGFLGMVAVFVRRALHSGVDDPAEIENRLGIPTYCVIPHSPGQAKLARLLKRGNAPAQRLLAVLEPNGVAMEALRSLRTAMHFGQLDARNNVLMLTGPAPGLGKSFVSANYAAILATSGKKVVVVDGDLRRGHLHEYFGVGRTPGLTDFVAGTASVVDVLYPSAVEGLHFVPTGTIPPNPSELLLSDKIGSLLEYLSGHYDTVIVDTPPVLAVTDAAVVGRFAGTTMLVLKAGEHSLRMIEDTIKRLQTAGVTVRGTIINQVGINGQGRYGYKYGYNYGYYNYNYAPKAAK